MRMDVPDTPHQRVSRVNVVAFGAPPEDYISRQDVLQWAMPLNSLSTFGGEVDPSDMVVVNRVLACPEDSLELD
jgi:hypothetical protein